jgi:death on curing protein
VKVRYPDLADYVAIAAAVTGTDPRTLIHASQLGLADSALHAPAASFGGEEFHPDFCDKAAVLLVRLAKNHPLLDGNKRAAWVTLRLFIEMNSWQWTAYPPSLRALLCPDPSAVLGYAPPRPLRETPFRTPAGTSDIHSVDWSNVSVPGSACEATGTIHFHDSGAVAPSAVHWPAVAVGTSSRAVYGDLEPGEETAALVIWCTNGGGTIESDLAEAAVVYRLQARTLEVVGVLTPQQPFSINTPHVPFVTGVMIERGQVVVHQAWYSPDDFPDNPTGKATTIWKLSRGVLKPLRTWVVWEKWSADP